MRRTTHPLFALGMAAMSCRAPSSNARYEPDPVTLVTPDSGPSALQRRLATLATSSTPGGSAELDRRLDAFHARTAAHRAYIAIDKPLYQPGETVWFRAFELASANLAAAEEDAGATFKLISPRGSTVVEKRLRVTRGGAAGDVPLQDGMPGGEYVLRVQTDRGTTAERKVIVSSYQAPRIKKKLEFLRKAYGPGDTVTAAVALGRATGEALAQKAITGLVTLDGTDLARLPITTDAQGNALVTFTLPAKVAKGDGLLTVLVDDGGVTESVQKRIPILLADVSLALYPEGGDLIAGLPGRVYFSARNALDKPADLEGKVVDDRGATVALLRSYHDGLGRFELQPDPARRYHVEITRPAGIARTFELPAAKGSGCALQAIDDFASQRAEVRAAVWCTSAQTVTATAVLRDKRVATARADVRTGEPAVLALPVPERAQGAVRVTVFDGKLAPLAERLVYRNRGADLAVTIKPDKATYHPRDKVELAIEAKDPDGRPVVADLAVAVVDDTVLSFADDKQATLFARMYLEAEMPGQKIEEPNFYFGTDPKAPAAIDLVLGTHGWRRFDWKPVLSGPPPEPIVESWAYTGDLLAPAKQGAPLRRAKAVAGEPEQDAVVREDAAPPRPAVAAQAPVRAAEREEAPPAPQEPIDAKDAPAFDEDAVGGMAAMDMDDEGDMMEARVMARAKALDFDNRGFDVGLEAKQRLVRIRDRARPELADDPNCCFEPERQFPLPSYAVRYEGPRTDFRETLLWAPRVATDATGKATLSFHLSDEVTSFRALAEGAAAGRLGRGEALVQSKKPVSLAVKLPLEVTAGDRIKLPVTIANETDQPYTARLTASFGKAFRIEGGALPPTLALAPNEHRATFYELAVVGDGKLAEDGKIALGVEAANLRDDVEKTIPVVSAGFPQEVSLAGTLTTTARHEVTVTDVMPGTMRGMITVYPSPLATMIEGTEAMIAEPGGCFEQASSTNYPNIMILGYLEEHGAASPQIAERANQALDRGYKLLTGYETKERGYEWFGSDPGHEALTAYGLMEFHDMRKVYGDVDRAMVERTRAWLRGRRDGKGGYQRSSQALDSFGAASPEVTDGYITYALTEAGEQSLDAELARQQQVATSTKDHYLMAMATKALLNARPRDEATRAAVLRLASMQAKDGSFPDADHSITRSGGEALTIESTAIAAMALMAAGPEHHASVRRAIEWMNAHRSGVGGYGSTQSTVLALKAMTAYAKASRRTEAAGTLIVTINGTEVARRAYDKGHQGAIEVPVAEHLRSGKNVIDLRLESTQPLPYSGVVTWGSKVPASDPATKVALATTMTRSATKLGEGVRVDVRVTNRTARGLPMTLARIGLPGGLTFQTWQLQELREKKLIDFYETRPREVILYFRALPPNAVKDVPIELLATVPGAYTAPASRAYLYYTAEHKHWVAPQTITVTP